MKYLILAIRFVIIFLCCNELLARGQSHEISIKETEEWVFKLIISNKGTRSEGRRGVLIQNGKIIKGNKEGEIIETPFGSFKWFGEASKDDALFRNRGWLNKLSCDKK